MKSFLSRHPYCSVENRNPRSTAALRSTGSVDSTGSDFGITPVPQRENNAPQNRDLFWFSFEYFNIKKGGKVQDPHPVYLHGTFTKYKNV